jgi:2-polyprenyl-3-methyl-5-hydroxy-6-metoxy-1,4-benzoquinol methylase
LTARGGGCPGCRSTRSSVAFRVGARGYLRCRDCRTLWAEDPPQQTEIDAVYAGERYFSNPEFSSGGYHGYKDYLADRDEIEEKFGRVLERVEAMTPPGRVLDVGAGPGVLLAAAAARGWEGVGVDLNPWAARTAAELGADVRVGTIEDAGFDDGEFDLVTMMDVVEHVHEPERMVAEVSRLVRPGGVAAFLTPDAGSIITRLMGSRWPEAQRTDHLVLFSVRGLEALLRRHGLEPVDWHWIGKRSSIETLLADVSPAAPGVGRLLQSLVSGRALGRRRVGINPLSKFCLYARAMRPAR